MVIELWWLIDSHGDEMILFKILDESWCLIEFDSHEVHEDWLKLKIMEYNIVTRNGDWLTGAKRTEWMGMGVAGIMKLIVLVDHSLIPYV